MLYFLRFLIAQFWLYNTLFCLHGCTVLYYVSYVFTALYYVSYVCTVLYYKRIVLHDMVDHITSDCIRYIAHTFCMDNAVLQSSIFFSLRCDVTFYVIIRSFVIINDTFSFLHSTVIITGKPSAKEQKFDL